MKIDSRISSYMKKKLNVFDWKWTGSKCWSDTDLNKCMAFPRKNIRFIFNPKTSFLPQGRCHAPLVSPQIFFGFDLHRLFGEKVLTCAHAVHRNLQSDCACSSLSRRGCCFFFLKTGALTPALQCDIRHFMSSAT